MFVSEGGANANHAEDVLLGELQKGSFPAIKEFYVSSTPCYQCTPKIIEYFSKSSPPTIYVSRVFNPYDSRNINAVMRLLVRGYKINSLTTDDLLKLVDEICYNEKKAWRKKLCKDAKAIIQSEVGDTRHKYTQDVLNLLKKEALKYQNQNIKDTDETNYIEKHLNDEIWKVIKEYQKSTCD